MIEFEVKVRGPKFTWEIVGIYRDPNEDMGVMESLAARTGYTRNYTKGSII
jgi:serine/threonine protein kinase HipA of HipAB toxin-antitoxin module